MDSIKCPKVVLNTMLDRFIRGYRYRDEGLAEILFNPRVVKLVKSQNANQSVISTIALKCINTPCSVAGMVLWSIHLFFFFFLTFETDLFPTKDHELYRYTFTINGKYVWKPWTLRCSILFIWSAMSLFWFCILSV